MMSLAHPVVRSTSEASAEVLDWSLQSRASTHGFELRCSGPSTDPQLAFSRPYHQHIASAATATAPRRNAQLVFAVKSACALRFERISHSIWIVA